MKESDHRRGSINCPFSPYRIVRGILWCLVVVLMVGTAQPYPCQARSGSARMANIIVTNSADDLLLYFTVKDAFPEKIKSTIESGVPATFSFFTKLYRIRRFWPDKLIADQVVTHTLKYDNLRKEFLIDRSWDDATQPLSTRSFEEAKRLMVDIDNLVVAPLQILDKGKRYQVRVKAKLSQLTLPFYLHYVLFFVSLWDFETDWYTVDFIY